VGKQHFLAKGRNSCRTGSYLLVIIGQKCQKTLFLAKRAKLLPYRLVSFGNYWPKVPKWPFLTWKHVVLDKSHFDKVPKQHFLQKGETTWSKSSCKPIIIGQKCQNGRFDPICTKNEKNVKKCTLIYSSLSVTF